MPIRDSEGETTHYVAINEDITLWREYEERLNWQANYDPLTSLPNRMLMLDRMSQVIALAARKNEKVAVLLLDLDRFNIINDTMGHESGDEVLRLTAQRLLTEQHDADTVARVGNAEFMMVLTDLKEPNSPQAVAARICESLKLPFVVGGTEIFISASIGIALYPDNGTSPQELLRSATTAMHAIEGEERGGWRFFTPTLPPAIACRSRASCAARWRAVNFT
jgi:diguanylate cyclase (GGDEF)-like protein